MLTKLLDDHQFEVGPLVWRVPARARAAATKDVDAAVADQHLRQAFEAGLRDGEERAAKRAEERIRQLAAQMADAIADLASTRAQVMGRAEADVVRLSIDIARRVLHRELTVDPEALGALARAALEKLGGQEKYRARVHPDHAALVRSCLEELRAGATVEIVADPALAQGSIIFDGAQGVLDASVETQLREIERGLVDQLEGRL